MKDLSKAVWTRLESKSGDRAEENTRRRSLYRSAGGAGMMAASESRLIKSGLCGRERSTSDRVIGVPLNGLLSDR